jgi:antitoxin component YwqK of YwqJK toxin-antitoxin module
MKKIILLLSVIAFIGCKDEKQKTDHSSDNIYSSNDVVKADGKVYFKRDMKEVTGIIHGSYDNGNNKEAYQVKNGVLNGFNNSWNEEGQQRYEGHYKDGKQNGLWKFWWPNGQLKAESNYRNGKLNGTKRSWDRFGSLISEESWIENNKQ